MRRWAESDGMMFYQHLRRQFLRLSRVHLAGGHTPLRTRREAARAVRLSYLVQLYWLRSKNSAVPSGLTSFFIEKLVAPSR